MGLKEYTMRCSDEGYSETDSNKRQIYFQSNNKRFSGSGISRSRNLHSLSFTLWRNVGPKSCAMWSRGGRPRQLQSTYVIITIISSFCGLITFDPFMQTAWHIYLQYLHISIKHQTPWRPTGTKVLYAIQSWTSRETAHRRKVEILMCRTNRLSKLDSD